MSERAIGVCKNESLNDDGQAPPSGLFNGQIPPFANMTIRGWLWYQGENNCGGAMGNSAAGFGYGCELVEMISDWRSIWSSTPGTTSPKAAFGLVTLASDGSEGHGENMAAMRWSQTGNWGSLPSPKIPNSFLAQPSKNR